ncbi:MAG: site-specific integrase [Sulfurimonas sp.]|uniref:tyrosine-type recombinase/integrase n=1 Tax=Sulfurimonas sp. TaxID=2022749 RepID=UPI0025F28DA4|nr:site-specific integrase [Sulfurimonas sp.]MCK9492460.1 site-specific integrase [Sulfurimonas sp.]
MTKTNYKGINTYKDVVKGTVFVGSFRIAGKLYKKIVGYTNDRYNTNAKMAFINKESLIEKHKNQDSQKIKKIYTFEQLFDEYIESVKQAQTVATIETKEYYFKKHIKSKLGTRYIADIIPGEIQKIINEMLKNGYAPQTAKHLNNIVKATLNYAIRMKYIDSNIADNVELPKFDNTVEYTLTNDEAKKLFHVILNFNELVYRGIFSFLLHGHRKSEVLNLSWEYIDLNNRVYEIPAKINKAKKNKKHPITDFLFSILIEVDDKSGYVFKSPVTGTKFNDIRKAWARIKKEAKINKPFRIHDIRHLIGNTTINELGLSSNVAAAILGHSTTKMVEERYSDVRIDTMSKGLDLIFEHLKK